MQKLKVHAAYATAAINCVRVNGIRSPRFHTRRNSAAIKPRPPATAKGDQVTALISTPPRLQQRAAATSKPKAVV